MGPVERVKTALAHREPDRVPTISCIDVQKHIYDSLGETPDNIYKYITNPFTARIIDLIAPLLNLTDTFGKDVKSFMLKKVESDIIMGYDSSWAMYADIFLLKNSKLMTDVYGGRLYKIVDDGFGNLDTPRYFRGTFNSPQDWRRFNKKRWEALPDKMFEFNCLLHEKFGDAIYFFGSLYMGVFENSWQPFGFPRFADLLYDERSFLQEMIEFNKNIYLRVIDATADAGLPGFIYSDDMAFKTGPMINPLLEDELYGPAFREITARAHSKGIPIIIHSDGWTIPLLPYFVKWGFDGHHSLEPTAGVDLRDCRNAVGHSLALLGHIDIAHVLSFGSREEVFACVQEAIAKAGAGGGLILGPTNSHPAIKVQNIRWMMEAVEEYGRYPLPAP
jgi:uroporphyrinogen decarboxylase